MKEIITLANFPVDKIYIFLNEAMRKEIISKSLKKLKLKNFFELSRWINKIAWDRYLVRVGFNGGDIKRWLDGECFDQRVNISYPKFIPLWAALELAKVNSISVSKLQRNTIAYRAGGSGKMITNPKLPILVTPEFESIVTHLFGDGYVGKGTPAYYQKRKEGRDNFIKKLKNCFGKFEENICESKWQARFPKAITDIISKYYSIDSYLSKGTELPLKIINRKDKWYKLACIVSFILDEGNIRDVVSACSSNYKLLSQIRELIEQCAYPCREIRFLKNSRMYNFSVRNKKIKDFLRDVKELHKRFPTCNLGYKQEFLINLIKQQSHITPRIYEYTDKIILKHLKKKPSTSKEIASKMRCTYGTVQRHLLKLYKNKKVKRILVSRNFIWGYPQ